MSAQVVTVFQWVATAMAAKTMLEGVKEGNLGKAVIGGIGAYMGLSSLGTAASASQAASEAAAQGATNGAGAAVATNLTSDAAAVTADGLANAGTEAAASQAGNIAAANSGTAAAEVGAKVAEPSFIDKVGAAWNGTDSATKYGMLQIGGGMLQGSAQEDMLHDKWDRDERLDSESRARRGYVAGRGLLSRQRYNPQTQQWEETN